MSLRMAFAGFRHFHILDLYKLAMAHDEVEVVAACEEHADTRGLLADRVQFTHDTCDAMFNDADFDILACGDYYGRRGEVLIRGLEAGKHVIADKPMCTSLEEVDRIEELSREKGLAVSCMLTTRGSANFLAMREVIRSGRIGEVHTICFQGEHPLNYGTRPGWYFEQGKHGGTINDIAIHAVDAIPWMTGRKIVEVTAARVWNARLKEVPWFQDGAQMLLKLDNDGGVIGDVSYFAPDSCGYHVSSYWRYTIHGTQGQVETGTNAEWVTLYTNDSKTVELVPPAEATPGRYFESFLDEIRGYDKQLSLTTAEVIESARTVLTIQNAADKGLHDVACVRTAGRG